MEITTTEPSATLVIGLCVIILAFLAVIIAMLIHFAHDKRKNDERHEQAIERTKSWVRKMHELEILNLYISLTRDQFDTNGREIADRFIKAICSTENIQEAAEMSEAIRKVFTAKSKKE